MKNKFTVILMSIWALTSQLVQAQQPSFAWAKVFNGTGDSQGNAIATDVNGNVYTTGYFTGTTDFDPGVGVFTLSTLPNDYDGYVTKTDASGNFLWAKALSGSNYDEGYGVSVDAGGNVFVCGTFMSNDFNVGVPTMSLSTNGGVDMFISKFNSTGVPQWLRGFGSNDLDFATSIATDASGNCYFTGAFRGTVDFDPSVALYNLATIGVGDLFVYKMDGAGNLVWVNAFGSPNSGNDGSGITLDATNNIYVCGALQGTVDFDPAAAVANLTTIGNTEMFVAKFTNSGAYVWAKDFDCNSGVNVIEGISVDANNNVLTTGYYNTLVDFDPGVNTFTIAPTGVDIFVSKLDNNGSFVWAKSFKGPNQDYGKGIATDASGNVYTTGFFAGTVDFDPGASVYTLSSVSNDDAFVTKLDPAGNFLNAYKFGNSNFDQATAISLNTGSIHLTGTFSGIVDFDPNVTSYTLTSNPGTYNAFVHKMNQCQAPSTPNNLTLLSNSKACVGSSLTLLSSSGTSTINWYNTLTSTTSIASGTSIVTSPTLSAGVYTYYTEAQSCTISPARTAIAFTIFANPVVTISGSNSVICNGETASLTASGASNFSWNTGASTSVIVVSPTLITTYTVAGTDVNGCHSTAVISQSVDACTAINSNFLKLNPRIKMYPNPATSVLYIELETLNGNTRLLISNSLGQVFMNEELQNQHNTINFQNFASGVYFVQVTNTNKLIDTQKIIKE